MKKKLVSAILCLILLLQAAALADTITREQFAAGQSLPEVYRQLGPVMRTLAIGSSEEDFIVEWVWYYETEEGLPLFVIHDENGDRLCYNGITYANGADGYPTAAIWLRGWQESVDLWTAPLMELPESQMQLEKTDDGYTLSILMTDEDGSVWLTRCQLTMDRLLTGMTCAQAGELPQEILQISPCENVPIDREMVSLLSLETYPFTCVMQDGTEKTFEAPRGIRVSFIENDQPYSVWLDEEGNYPLSLLPWDHELIKVYEGFSLPGEEEPKE